MRWSRQQKGERVGQGNSRTMSSQKRQGVIMGLQLRNRPARYTLGAGVAVALAIGTGGLVAASAAASPASSAGGRNHRRTSLTKQKFGTAKSGPDGGG